MNKCGLLHVWNKDATITSLLPRNEKRDSVMERGCGVYPY